jgi:hypothetical protein
MIDGHCFARMASLTQGIQVYLWGIIVYIILFLLMYKTSKMLALFRTVEVEDVCNTLIV